MSAARKKKHVLVTGGGGFIGSHLCESLLVRGYSVTALDNFVTGQIKNLDEARDHEDFSLIEADVCEAFTEEKWPQFERDGLYGVFHFACPASPIDFEKIPLEILKVDSVGTIHAVDLAARYGARLVIASTSEVYGDPLVHPQKETYWGNVNPIGSRACYDETKRFGEAYVSSAARPESRGGKNLNAGIVRIFNTYGPRMRADDGRVVPELCIQALQGKALTIHGDGKQTRSFCFVTDLVDGIIRAFESNSLGPFNLGNPSERTILDFAEAVRQLTGSRSTIQHLPGREDDPKRRCPDITRAKTELGWTPKVDLQEGLRKTVDYFRDELSGS
jgi:dTDP-glucose 4,6-dehydratase